MKIHILLLPILLGILTVSATAKSYPLETERDIREAAFRYQFNHNISGLQKNAAFYFLSVGAGAKDPSDEFMKRFKDDKPPVKKVSQSMLGQSSEVKDKATGKRGLIFFATNLKWVSASKAQIQAGYNEANLSAGSNTYILQKKGQKWVVIKDIPGPVA